MGSNSGPIAISHIQSAIDPLEQGHEEKTCSGDSAHYNIPKSQVLFIILNTILRSSDNFHCSCTAPMSPRAKLFSHRITAVPPE